MSQKSWPADRSERRYALYVQRHLPRNFTTHLTHGLFGQTGFRLLQAPTFLPAFVLLLSGGSEIAVGAALALQSLGMALTPLFGATLIQHRSKVLPMGFLSGIAMRLSILWIALAGFLLSGGAALVAVLLGLFAFGLFQGMQGVIFNFLMSKVIPVSKRGRLTGLRNALSGATAAAVAYIAGAYFLGETPTAEGYSQTFLLAFVLTSIGLASLLLMREPEPPVVRERQSFREELRRLPAFLQQDRPFRRYVLARAIATLGRMSLPFYIVYAGTQMSLTGDRLAALTIAFALSQTISNLLWGLLADHRGFRFVLLLSLLLWIAATALLPFAHIELVSLLVFVGVGAATQGFQGAAQNLTLEFGERTELPVRIAVANSTSEIAGAIGPLLGGLIAALLGYPALFICAVAFLVIGGWQIARFVPDPRFADRSR